MSPTPKQFWKVNFPVSLESEKGLEKVTLTSQTPWKLPEGLDDQAFCLILGDMLDEAASVGPLTASMVIADLEENTTYDYILGYGGHLSASSLNNLSFAPWIVLQFNIEMVTEKWTIKKTLELIWNDTELLRAHNLGVSMSKKGLDCAVTLDGGVSFSTGRSCTPDQRKELCKSTNKGTIECSDEFLTFSDSGDRLLSIFFLTSKKLLR